MYCCHFCGKLANRFTFHPRDSSFSTCRDEACTTCMEIKELNEQISQLQSSLTDLLEQRRELKSKFNHAAHPSIVNRLPHEISSAIFSFYTHSADSAEDSHLGDKSDDGHIVLGKYIDSPLTLGAVCRTWQQFVWSSPELWVSLKLTLISPFNPTPVRLAIEWLSRSAQLPLTLRLATYIGDDYHDFKDDDGKKLLPLINYINSCSLRWYSLHLLLPDDFLALFNNKRGGSPILHDFGLQCYESSSLRSMNIVHVAPKIVRLGINLKLDDLRFQWENVTHFSSSASSVDKFLEVIQQLPQLASCRYKILAFLEDPGMPHNHGVDNSSRRIVHPKLQSLDIHIHDDHRGTIKLFFDMITFPSLTDLKLSFLGSAFKPEGSLTSFLRRSKCRLETMKLNWATVDGEDLRQIAAQLPWLKHLHLDLEGIFDPDLRPSMLTAFQAALSGCCTPTTVMSTQEEPFLPRLKTFDLTGSYIFSPDLITDLFSPSIGTGSLRPLESVHIICHCGSRSNPSPIPDIDQSTLQCIADARRRGVNFTLQGKYLDGKPEEFEDLLEKYLKAKKSV